MLQDTSLARCTSVGADLGAQRVARCCCIRSVLSRPRREPFARRTGQLRLRAAPGPLSTGKDLTIMNRLAQITRSTALGAFLAALAACNTEEPAPSAAPVLLERASQALLANDVFGSDTLFAAMTEAFEAAPTSTPLVYLGTGSGNGERCIRGAAPPDVCAATPPVQAIAPMSRALSSPLPGEVETRIAIDGIAIVANSSIVDPGLALSGVLTAFCGADGQGLDAETSCAAPDRLPGVKFRRDDASGTTEVFEQLAGCSAFCPDVQIVQETLDGPSIGGLLPDACEATDSATSCIGKLVAADTTALGYSGQSVLQVAGTRALSVDGVPFSPETLQALVSAPRSAYAFARFVFLNANLDNLIGSGSAQEEFHAWALTDEPQAFEAILTANDFIACSPEAPLGCQAAAPSDAGAPLAPDGGTPDTDAGQPSASDAGE
jgi:phosphate transport system substrate-binding protein